MSSQWKQDISLNSHDLLIFKNNRNVRLPPCSKLFLVNMVKIACTKQNPKDEIFKQVHIYRDALSVQVKLMERLVPFQRYESYFVCRVMNTTLLTVIKMYIVVMCVGHQFEFRTESGGQCLLKDRIMAHTMRYYYDVPNYSKHDMQVIFRLRHIFCGLKFKGHHSHFSAACEILSLSGHNGHRPERQ